MSKLASILNNLEYRADKPAISVLLETENTKEIRIAMKPGHVMKKHQTPFPIVIEIFEGAIEFGVEEKIMSLRKGDLIALEGNVPHNLKAIENSIIRLTLSKQDEAQRVKNIVK